MATAEKIEHKPTAPEDIEYILNELKEGIATTFDTADAKAEFSQLIESLEEKKTTLTKTFNELEGTKNTLHEELRIRNHEAIKLTDVLKGLEEERNKINEAVEEGKQKLAGIRDEEEKIKMLLGNLKVTIEEMKKTIPQVIY